MSLTYNLLLHGVEQQHLQNQSNVCSFWRHKTGKLAQNEQAGREGKQTKKKEQNRKNSHAHTHTSKQASNKQASNKQASKQAALSVIVLFHCMYLSVSA